MKLWKTLKSIAMESRAEEGAAKKRTTGRGSVESADSMSVNDVSESLPTIQSNDSEKFVKLASLLAEAHKRRDSAKLWEQFIASDEIGHIVLTLAVGKTSLIIGGVIRIDLVQIQGRNQARVHIECPKFINVGRIDQRKERR